MTAFILGGAQTDFARHWAKEGLGLRDMLREAVEEALADAAVDVADVDVVHIGNLAGELFAGQAQLGGLAALAVPGLAGLPSTRHEAACASGGTALLAADADLAAGRYDLALVVGVELMRNVPADQAAAHLGSATWAGHEAIGATYPWPALFAEIAQAYDERFGLDADLLGEIARSAFANAARNPLAQARDWRFEPSAFTADDTANPVVEGRLRKTDCGRITDGAAALLLASPRYAEAWARARGRSLDTLPALRGFGHRTDVLPLADKLARRDPGGVMFPHLAGTVADAYRRAGIAGPGAIDVAELHDCFTITALVALEHLGLVGPGEGGRLVEDGVVAADGTLPVNPGGGLLGLGHPVGATGVRMALDAARQVAGTAGPLQVEGARTALTLNVGGSLTTTVATVIGRGEDA
ncbi:acetyl-CoA acetyltransferase [Yinghuangia seranimata]|uniref:acetyl-CoA acetyltransferase n=1 Tax=Yinghuangia seranimata TaxID=408067 RepID=UPI00248CA3DE|nr:acetyl-CoA acetyltransferase [Yinghuangia seranimata]MDI2125882.1 acetyl-CoA acetyltransferase [Yinghuangia seranimata]